jgi:hypothetical protein
MRHIISRMAITAIASAALLPAAGGFAVAAAPSPVTMTVHVALAGNLEASTTQGTFELQGAITDAGSESGAGRFAGQGHLRTGQPNSLHSTMTLTGAAGTIDVRLTGLFGHLPAPTATGWGQWLVTGGTGAYASLQARGKWTATADFTAAIAKTGPPTVSFTLSGSAN